MAPPPGIRAASYSGVRVYETSCRGLPVMRRVADAYINATQILRAAGLPKPQRTKILERDVTGGVHEKVQGGYAGFQGTWIPLDSARLLARAHGIEQDLETFLAFVPQPGDEELPAKEKRKRPTVITATAASSASLSAIQRAHQGEDPTPITPSGSKWGTPTSATGPSYPPSSDDEEPEEGEVMELTAPGTPESRRTTTMSLRPPGSRTKRRVTYPGEDEDDVESLNGASGSQFSSPSKRARRTLSPFSRGASPAVSLSGINTICGPSTNDVTKSVAAFTNTNNNNTNNNNKAASSSPRPSSFSRDKTPPHAGKRCEGCGVTSTPQWRRGPSGKRTLCNACGVKWSFGRLNTKNGGKNSLASGPDEDYSDESDLMDQMDLADVGDLVSEASPLRLPTTATTGVHGEKLATQVKQLKRRLRDSERGRKRLREILEEAALTDDPNGDVLDATYGGDRSAAAVAAAATLSRAATSALVKSAAKPIYYTPISPFSSYPASSVGGGADDSRSESEEDSESEADQQSAHEAMVVRRFLRAVKQNRARMEYNISRMRLDREWMRSGPGVEV